MVRYASGHKHNVLKTFEGESFRGFDSHPNRQGESLNNYNKKSKTERKQNNEKVECNTDWQLSPDYALS